MGAFYLGMKRFHYWAREEDTELIYQKEGKNIDSPWWC